MPSYSVISQGSALETTEVEDTGCNIPTVDQAPFAAELSASASSDPVADVHSDHIIPGGLRHQPAIIPSIDITKTSESTRILSVHETATTEQPDNMAALTASQVSADEAVRKVGTDYYLKACV
jgi:hypothetical protein